MTIDPTSRSAQSLVSALASRPRDVGAAEKAGLTPQFSQMPAAATGEAFTSEVRSLSRDLAANPPVDAGKVAAIRAGIAAGSYTVQPDRLADAMISSAR